MINTTEIKLTFGKITSGNRKERDTNNFPLNYYNTSKSMNVTIELNRKEVEATLTLERLNGESFELIKETACGIKMRRITRTTVCYFQGLYQVLHQEPYLL